MKQETLPWPRAQRSEARSRSDTVLPAHLALTLTGGFFTRDPTLVCIEVGPLLLGTSDLGLLVSAPAVGSCTHGSRFCPSRAPRIQCLSSPGDTPASLVLIAQCGCHNHLERAREV